MAWQDKEQKGRELAQDIDALAAQATAAGFETTGYVLKVAVAELWKQIEREVQARKGGPA
jgi:hypothetical protein